MSLWDSVKSLLLARPLTVQLLLLEPISTAGLTRRELAATARRAIADALNLEPKAGARSS
jgi:hypothetical protein